MRARARMCVCVCVCVCSTSSLPGPTGAFSRLLLCFFLFQPWVQPLLQAPRSLLWARPLETKVWASGVLITAGVSLLLHFFSGQSWETYTCIQYTLAHVCISLSFRLYFQNCDSMLVTCNSTEFISSGPFHILNFLLQEGGIGHLSSGTYLLIWSSLAFTWSSF